MDPAKSNPSLAQRRILWWMATTGERPHWISGRASWEGGPRSDFCPHGLGRPYLPRLSVEAMLDAGIVSIETESYPPQVLQLQSRSGLPPAADLPPILPGNSGVWRQSGPRLILTELGRELAPAQPSYPWRPNTGGARDVTRSEVERQRKIATYRAAFRREGVTTASPPIPNNVVVAAFGAQRS